MPLDRGLPFVMAVLAAFTCSSVQANQTAATPPPAQVLVEQAKLEDLAFYLEYPGRTAGYREVQVRAQVSGILQQRSYQEGSQVKQGQVLFSIDPRTYQAALARAKGALAQEQARYRQTERDLRRIRELQAKGFASESELDNAISNFEQSKANIEAAKAEVQSKQIDLDYTTVEAPISGITSKEAVSEGSLIVANDPNSSLLTQITQLDPIYVNYAYADREAARLREAVQSGEVRLPAGNQLTAEIIFGDGTLYAQKGKVDFTDSLVDKGTGTVSARAIVPNAEQALLPGQFVRIRISGMIRPKSITVPEKALAQSPAGNFVYVVDEQGLAQLRPVDTDVINQGRWVIRSGLKEGERVIVDGLIRVRPKQPVQIVDALPTQQP
ncbi:efflux RND transporter periplasmic adaptor subunit [Pseudomonas sp. R-28-1W-6]|jgi:membrane fusion protein (multidrug efflux system)|uniref:efflux RND transporter periplasmic adaptor subunit n=1 Tax=Pseudomonas sp. R-28-1W-6 TaxID=2650101 RepID=UPI0013651E73|nr:efflux RND transporter periplasmic adaptor subunit [Pseudomonas sp. R-28-1W-6]MWV11999.1 efflux RND transporter periplasmic adaptor subunit [Pseudomonas sp. R-28-1W-6]